MKKDNFVIEVLDLEHGQRVKKYFESLGVDVSLYFFDSTRKDNDTIRYYGVIDGFFNNYAEKNLPSHVQVIKLPAGEAEKTLEEKIKELALSENKVVKNLILEDVPNIKWCLVWHKGSLKPNIVEEDCIGGYNNIIPLPDDINEFINKNFM